MKMTQKECHEYVREKMNSPNHPWATPQWILVSDGSGYQDGYGGYCSYVIHIDDKYPPKIAAAAIKETTVERAEFLALLSGLEMITTYLAEGAIKEGSMAETKLEVKQPVLQWITDRESLALCVLKDPKTKEPVYARRSTPDLWRAFSYYEKLYSICPVFCPRQSNSQHDIADEIASDLRVQVKEYFEWRKENGKIT